MIKVNPIESPILDLNYSSIEEHCLALCDAREYSFWWYQGRSSLFGNYSLPFRTEDGTWWYQVKPGLCWPSDFLKPMCDSKEVIPFFKNYLGYQHVVSNSTMANSRLVINVIEKIRDYGPETVSTKRRNAIRKGLSDCIFEVLKHPSRETIEECRLAWNDLSRRTGWKNESDSAEFLRTWRFLLDCPGISVIVGRERVSGRVAGFLVTKIIGTTAYVDTIASRDFALGLNVNDVLIYAFVTSAARIAKVEKAHYAIKSRVESLERFKTGIGFTPIPFPAYTMLRVVPRLALKIIFNDKYKRMIGEGL